MASDTQGQAQSSGSPGDPDAGDRRVAVFCSPCLPELFHAFAYASDIWKHDPFDVEAIHQNARDRFQRIVDRVLEPSGLATGRILLLLGEAGSGKTHLMRALRNRVHSRGIGYCGYLQMTAFTEQYGRYVLGNVIDSLDKPYDGSRLETTGLSRLSNALAESCGEPARERLVQLREGGLEQSSLDRLVGELADLIIRDERFSNVDAYLVQALLYLQSNDARIKARVLKYLRCEDLTERDRLLLGGIVPCIYPDAPHRVIERLGRLMWALEEVPLVLCVDQLEDVFDLDAVAVQFRRAMATLCDIVSRLPSAIVIIACLEDFYDQLKTLLTKPIKDRVEDDPPPVSLQVPCAQDEVVLVLARRLKFLYESSGVPFQLDEPTYPVPDALVRRLAGLRVRDVLREVHLYREHCVEKGKMADYPFEDGRRVDQRQEEAGVLLEQAWNEFRSTFSNEVSADESVLAVVLSEGIRSCSVEAEVGEYFEAEPDGNVVEVEHHAADESVVRILVGICNKGAQGGGLGRQIDQVVQRAGEHTVVIVRSTGFPKAAKSAVVKQLDTLVAAGGRRVVVEDSDWRAMMALSSFRQQRELEPSFAVWCRRTRPLTSRLSLRAILGLDRPGREGSAVPGSALRLPH